LLRLLVKINPGNRGSSLPEVLATVGIVTVLMSIAVLGLGRRYADLESSHQELVNSIRETRLRATLKGAHYRLTALGTSYEIERLQDTDGDGIWDVDGNSSVRAVLLPPGVTIAAANLGGSEAAVEFNTRGVTVDPAGGPGEVVQLTLSDAASRTRVVEVWPSGQVQNESILGALP
jgi:Tfp pilus assembly protein FimT